MAYAGNVAARIIIEIVAVDLPKGNACVGKFEIDLRYHTVCIGLTRLINGVVGKIEIVVFVVFDIEDRARRSVGGVERHYVDLIRRVVCNNVPALCRAIAVRKIVQFGVRSIGGRLGHFRAREINAAVLIARNGVVISVRRRRRFHRFFFAVKLRNGVVFLFRRVLAYAVQHKLSEVDVRIRGVIACFEAVEIVGKIGLIKIVRLAARNGVRSRALVYLGNGSRRVDAIDLIVSGRIFVADRHVHRIIYVAVRLAVLALVIEKFRFRSLDERGVFTCFGVVRFQRGIFFVQAVNNAVLLHKTIGGGVVRKTEIIARHRFRTVEFRALEVDPAVFYRTAEVFIRRGGCVIDVIAVNVHARVEVLRHEQHGNDRFHVRVIARLQIRRGNTHQRAFHHFAVGVVRRRGLHTVDKVDVIALLHGKSAVGIYRCFCRGGIFKFLPLVRFFLTACKRKHGSQTCDRRNTAKYFFANILHI